MSLGYHDESFLVYLIYLLCQVGAVGEGICTNCLAGYFTEADGGSTSIDEYVECGVNFQVRGMRSVVECILEACLLCVNEKAA